MRETIFAAARIANDVYLNSVLARSAPDKQAQIKELYGRHMMSIADYCVNNYGGAGTLSMAFIRGLHRMLFPQGYTYRQEIDGKLFSLVPGEYRDGQGCADSLLHPDTVVTFAPPEEVSEAMENIVARLNTVLPTEANALEKRHAILLFIMDFASIHPFGDANGRVMCMVCDLLLIKEELPPIHLCAIKEKDREGLYRAVEQAQRNRDLTPLYEVIERYNPAALGRLAKK